MIYTDWLIYTDLNARENNLRVSHNKYKHVVLIPYRYVLRKRKINGLSWYVIAYSLDQSIYMLMSNNENILENIYL